jgi:hypothetical protein
LSGPQKSVAAFGGTKVLDLARLLQRKRNFRGNIGAAARIAVKNNRLGVWRPARPGCLPARGRGNPSPKQTQQPTQQDSPENNSNHAA